jgi:integrase
LEDGKSPDYIEPLLNHFRGKLLSKIKANDIRAAARKLYPDRKPATWNRQVITPVRAIINHASQEGLCPSIRVTQFKVEKVKKVAATPEWIVEFRASAIEHNLPHLATLCWFLFETGCRISEAVGLTIADVDLINCKADLGETKNGESYDTDFSPELRDELSAGMPKEGKVFGYATRQSVYNSWRNTCVRAGIEYIPPHQAGRHSFATMLNAMGWTANDIAAAGRWKSARLVQDTYIHSNSSSADAVKAIGTLLTQHASDTSKGGKSSADAVSGKVSQIPVNKHKN